MKFVVSSTYLSSNLHTIGRVIASKNDIPIRDCFLFQLEENKLTITASDGEVRVTTSIQVQDVEGEGLFAVPSKNILDALKELPEQPVTFKINDQNLELVILYQNGKYNFTAKNGAEYPHAKPLAENATTINISAENLATGISRTLFATAEDELRPVMNGILFDITEDNITFVASDGHKLVRFKNLVVKGNEKNAFILPKKPANFLKTILPKENGDITVSFDDNNSYFKLEQTTIISRLIEGRYPNYNSVIPTNNPLKVTADRLLLLNAMKRVSVFANPASSLVKLLIEGSRIQISAQDVDYSTSAEEEVACVYDGERIAIGFKGSYLIDILSNIPASEVVLELADPARPGLILPDENEADEELLMLLMPMMLNE
ncbi:MAG: DNA polymerase III subunit beta [Dysgonamonadaceae bacterium]|jgi:DNA polymerase-3 subunit beta|nr:DNA polymerase III subunit beta [Dysgonamonadaceae bacterium]